MPTAPTPPSEDASWISASTRNMAGKGRCVHCVSFGGWNGMAVWCARFRICPSLPELGCNSFEREPGCDDGPITPPSAA